MCRCKRALTCVRPLVRLRSFLPGASRQWSAPCFALRASELGIPLGVLRKRLAVFRSVELLAMRRASRSRRGHRCLLQTRDPRSEEESTKVCAWLTSSTEARSSYCSVGDNNQTRLIKSPGLPSTLVAQGSQANQNPAFQLPTIHPVSGPIATTHYLALLSSPSRSRMTPSRITN